MAGWFAFSLIHQDNTDTSYIDAWSVLLKTLLSFLLIALPCMAAACAALRHGCRNLVILGLVGIAALGVESYFSFWLWFKLRGLGRVENWVLAIGCALYILFSFATSDAAGRKLLTRLCLPLGLTGAASLFVVSLGFLYGGVEDPFYTSATRFSAELPADNRIPYSFAEWVVHRHEKPPRFVDWQSSDRPPLQTGLYVSQYIFSRGELGYEVTSVVAQCLWVFALWMLLTALELDRRVIVLSLAVCLSSGFILQNSFYTWPKLLAAAYMIGCAALLLSKRFDVLHRGRWILASLAGALLGFGMLSHGGSMFAALGLGAIVLVRRGPVRWRNAAVLAATAILVYLPWMSYQKFYDPPGNRLLKLHLAGVYEPDHRPLGEVIKTAYEAITRGEWLDGRIQNAGEIFDHQAEYWGNSWRLLLSWADEFKTGSAPPSELALNLRLASFFHLLPCLSVLMFGPLALAAGIVKRSKRSNEWSAGAQMWLFVVLTSLFWCLVMFIPRSTVLHQGTYVMVLFGMAGSVLAFWSVWPALACVVSGLFFSANFLPYVVLLKPSGPAGYLEQDDLSRPFLWGLIPSLILVVWLLYRLAREEAIRNGFHGLPENTNAGERGALRVAEQK